MYTCEPWFSLVTIPMLDTTPVIIKIIIITCDKKINSGPQKRQNLLVSDILVFHSEVYIIQHSYKACLHNPFKILTEHSKWISFFYCHTTQLRSLRSKYRGMGILGTHGATSDSAQYFGYASLVFTDFDLFPMKMQHNFFYSLFVNSRSFEGMNMCAVPP